MKPARTLAFSLLLLVSAANGQAPTVKHALVGRAAMPCRATLSLPENPRGADLVVFFSGTGWEDASTELHPVALGLAEEQATAIATIDKPGFPDDFERYLQHTSDDLVACAVETIQWAISEVRPKNFFLLGHSDGSSVLLRSLAKLLPDRDFPQSSLRLVQLTSPMLGTWKDKLQFQLADQPKSLQEILEICANASEENCPGKTIGSVPLRYLKRSLELGPPEETLKKLILGYPELKFAIYRGDADEQIPLPPWLALESWKAKQEASLQVRLSLETFACGHCLSEVADTLLPAMIRQCADCRKAK